MDSIWMFVSIIAASSLIAGQKLHPSSRVKRVVNGQPDLEGRSPHQVSIRRYRDCESREGSHVCSGSLISENWAITAANCQYFFKSYDPYYKCNTTNVRKRKIECQRMFGVSGEREHCQFGTAALRMITQIKIHENYNKETYQNDIAVVEMIPWNKYSSKLKFKREHAAFIRPIKLAFTEEAWFPDHGKEVGVTGWGVPQNQDHGWGSKTLEWISLRAIDHRKCDKIYGPRNPVSNTQICATGITFSNGDACEGDSGAPMVGRYDEKTRQFIDITNGTLIDDKELRLVGIVSVGANKCEDIEDGKLDDYKPGVYTKVSSYISWISSATGIPYRDFTGAESRLPRWEP